MNYQYICLGQLSVMCVMTDHFNGEALGRHYKLMLYPLGTERRDDG